MRALLVAVIMCVALSSAACDRNVCPGNSNSCPIDGPPEPDAPGDAPVDTSLEG